MSHPFGELINQYLNRKRSLSQSKLAAGILQEPAIISKMCKGERLSGRQARERVVSIAAWLHNNGVLFSTKEANALLIAAAMAPLRESVAEEYGLMTALQRTESSISSVAQPIYPASNLPEASTPFVGRLTDIHGVRRHLADPRCRLVTIVGPGGVGKTRLAVEIARASAGQFAHNVCFVDLQPVAEARELPFAIANALGLAISADGDPVEHLVLHLGNKALLLVLDNFEHLSNSAPVLSVILRRTTMIKMLVTSRESLNIAEEWQFRIGGVAYPPTLDNGRPADWAEFDAVQVFCNAVHRVHPGFDVGEQITAITRICQLTEGMPLALEIAASWTRVLSCSEIAQQLSESLRALTSSVRNAPARHRSLEATFDHSWQMLTEQDRFVFSRLSVFRGGFTRDTARHVANADLQTLLSLADRSMLHVLPNGRYRLHELLRQYGAERLSLSPGDLSSARQAHGAHFLNLLAKQVAIRIPGDQLEALSLCRPEMDNLMAAWYWAIETGDADALRHAVAAMSWILQYQNRFLEMVNILADAYEGVLRMSEHPRQKATQIEILVYYAWSHLRLGRFTMSEKLAELSLDQQSVYSVGPEVGWANDAMTNLSIAAAAQGDFLRARTLAEQAIERANRSGQLMNAPVARYAYANAALALGDAMSAKEAILEAIRICDQFNEKWFLAYALNTLGEIEAALGAPDSATLHYQRAFELRETFGDREGMAVALNSLGELALAQHDANTASSRFGQSQKLYQDLSDLGGMATAVKGLGEAALLDKDFDLAASYFKEALITSTRINYTSLTGKLLYSASVLLHHIGRQELAAMTLFGLEQHPATEQSYRLRAQQFRVAHNLSDRYVATISDWNKWLEKVCYDVISAI